MVAGFFRVFGVLSHAGQKSVTILVSSDRTRWYFGEVVFSGSLGYFRFCKSHDKAIFILNFVATAEYTNKVQSHCQVTF